MSWKGKYNNSLSLFFLYSQSQLKSIFVLYLVVVFIVDRIINLIKLMNTIIIITTTTTTKYILNHNRIPYLFHYPIIHCLFIYFSIPLLLFHRHRLLDRELSNLGMRLMLASNSWPSTTPIRQQLYIQGCLSEFFLRPLLDGECNWLVTELANIKKGNGKH